MAKVLYNKRSLDDRIRLAHEFGLFVEDWHAFEEVIERSPFRAVYSMLNEEQRLRIVTPFPKLLHPFQGGIPPWSATPITDEQASFQIESLEGDVRIERRFVEVRGPIDFIIKRVKYTRDLVSNITRAGRIRDGRLLK